MIEFSYIHIPFCSKKCKYCGFTSFVNLSYIEKYVSALILQIEKEYDKTPQKTVYFGGGTPSLLNLEQVEKILRCFNLAKVNEITFEINPENASLEYLSGLFSLGVNRLSFGVQTFNDNILKEINRRHGASDALFAINRAHNAGFENISIDLIYGLPSQTETIWQNDLKLANSLDIAHISTYGLKIEENTFYGKFPPKNIADDEAQAKMYETSIEKLTNFTQYEFSNFAKSANFQSKHNLNYWNLTPYNGFGLSASGFNQKTRYKNTSSIQKYLENPCLKEETTPTSKQSLFEEEIFLGFRKTEGINTNKIKKIYNINFDEKFAPSIEKYTKTGHIIKTENGYRLSTKGILISNYILSDFLW